MTETEFITVVKKKISSDEVYSLRVYDFEDIAIKFAYSDNLFEDEDVEQNNFSSFCENY